MIIDTDILVVGGGGAGFRAAIAAAEKGMKVLLLSKGPLARCGATPMAGADFTLDGASMSRIPGLAGDPEDTPEKVFNDIVTQGCFLNNQKLVDQYIRKAPQCLQELIEWGIQIKVSDERMIFTSGTGIMDALLRKARSLGIQMLEDIFLFDLVTAKGAVAGALGIDIRSGDFIRFRCKAVVMATGGWHKAFRPTTGMRDLSGEGIAMAHRAGADLGNMEFITFCCNVFLNPPIWAGSIAPYILSMLVDVRLTNCDGDEFLKSNDPVVVKIGASTEWNKSFISHATAKEIRAGRGFANGGIHYSRGDAPWEDIEFVASMIFPKWKYKALDLSEWGRKLRDNEPVEVGPAVEYFEGGIKVNEHFETALPGLFAAGECTLGAFGANRVFAAITEMLVHGADAGENAAAYTGKSDTGRPADDAFAALEEKAAAPLSRVKGVSPQEIRGSVQTAAHTYLGPIRVREELITFIRFLNRLKKDAIPHIAVTTENRRYNKEWIDALELENMVELLAVAAESALLRTESRGVHFREDYPHTDNDNWLKESIAKRTRSGSEVHHVPVAVTSMTPPKGVTAYMDFIKEMMLSHSDTGGKH
ncbi:MAG: FAD-binding protein [Desulfobacterales bacterium]